MWNSRACCDIFVTGLNAFAGVKDNVWFRSAGGVSASDGMAFPSSYSCDACHSCLIEEAAFGIHYPCPSQRRSFQPPSLRHLAFPCHLNKVSLSCALTPFASLVQEFPRQRHLASLDSLCLSCKRAQARAASCLPGRCYVLRKGP